MTAQDTISPGRRAPHTVLGEWVLLSKVSVGAKVLYWALKAHVNSDREDNRVWPSQDYLAEIIEKSQPTVNRYLKELIKLRAIDKRGPKEIGGGCEYVVHETPPDDYEDIVSLRQFRARRKARTQPDRSLPAAPLAARVATPKVERSPRTPTPTPTPTPTANGAPGRVLAAVGVTPTRLLAGQIEAAMAAGWTEDQLVRALAGCTEGADAPARVAGARLRKLGRPGLPPGPDVRPRCSRPAHENQLAHNCPLCAGERKSHLANVSRL